MKKTYLFGSGGCGMEFVKYNYEFDFNNHTRNILIPKDARFIYLMAHPYNVLLSFEQRGFIPYKGWGVFQIQGDVFNLFINDVKDLDSYLDINHDCFQLGNHFNCIYKQEAVGLFVKYEHFAQCLEPELKKFGIIKKNNRPILERTSDYKNANPELLKKLDKVHGRYAKHYKKLPMFFTNKDKINDYCYNEKYD